MAKDTPFSAVTRTMIDNWLQTSPEDAVKPETVFETGAARTDGSDPKSDLSTTSKVRKLVSEVNDGAPDGTQMVLLEETFPANAASL